MDFSLVKLSKRSSNRGYCVARSVSLHSPSCLLSWNDFVCWAVRYGYVFQDTDPTFNAGVYAIDLSLWEKKNFLNDVYFWMNQVATDHLTVEFC